jgi:hypothetical protein
MEAADESEALSRETNEPLKWTRMARANNGTGRPLRATPTKLMNEAPCLVHKANHNHDIPLGVDRQVAKLSGLGHPGQIKPWVSDARRHSPF